MRFETAHQVASGKRIPVAVTASLLAHDNRKYLWGYFYDITERKAMDDVLKQSVSRSEGAVGQSGGGPRNGPGAGGVDREPMLSGTAWIC